MAKMIDANAFIEHHCKDCPYRLEGSCADEDPICSTIIDLKDFPTVDAVEVVHGRWQNNANDYPECDKCGYMPQYDPMIDDIWYSPYCPNCGAKMDGDGNGT